MQKLLEGKGGPIIAAIVLLIAAFTVYFLVFSKDGMSSVADDTANPYFIDETGATFRAKLSLGENAEIKNPKTGKPGYRVEWCWWTKDGKKRPEPFPVLLNEYQGKPGPTFCPDCERLVVPHNPQFLEGAPDPKLPPLKSEYRPR